MVLGLFTKEGAAVNGPCLFDCLALGLDSMYTQYSLCRRFNNNIGGLIYKMSMSPSLTLLG